MDVDKQKRDLFSGDTLKAAQDRRAEQVSHRLALLKEYELGGMLADDVIDDLLQNHNFGSVNVKTQATKRVRSESWEGGHFVLFEVPVEGNIQLLFCKPSRNYPGSPMTGAIQGTSAIAIAFSGHTVEEIHRQVQSWSHLVREATASLNEEARNWDQKLMEMCYQQLEAKLKRTIPRREIVETVQFDLQESEDPSSLTTAEEEVISRRKDYIAADRTHSLQYFIAPDDYQRILQILNQTAQVFGRMPIMAPKLKETDIRNALLVALNRHYQGSPNGEVFTCLGKTDIVIRYEGANIFYADCDTWKGADALKETLDEVLDYVTWQDTRTVVILFNRKGDFSTVLDQLDEAIRSHPNYAETTRSEPVTMRHYVFYTDMDPERTFDLTVLAVDIPLSGK